MPPYYAQNSEVHKVREKEVNHLLQCKCIHSSISVNNELETYSCLPSIQKKIILGLLKSVGTLSTEDFHHSLITKGWQDRDMQRGGQKVTQDQRELKSLTTYFYNFRILPEMNLHLCRRWSHLAPLKKVEPPGQAVTMIFLTIPAAASILLFL